jgi:endo-1,3-1,4-beta-glycanase ExoK
MEWTPEYVSWSIDGHEVRHASTNDTAVTHMHKPQSLRMNFWTPTFHSWGHDLEPVDMPWYVLYDYVEVFEWDHNSNDFKLFWRDDFETFDVGRWHKASGGFEANSSVFHPSNAYVKAGNLVLKMEPDAHHDSIRDAP